MMIYTKATCQLKAGEEGGNLCEFENRCLNNEKCFRCNNQSLLKLKETKTFKNKTSNKKELTKDNSWEDLEQTVVDKLNAIPDIQKARRSRASGALWFEKGDIIDTILHPECKERTGTVLKSGERSMSIKKEWLDKALIEADDNRKTMVLPFRFKEDDNVYAIMKMDDIAELVTMMKAYIKDNELKTIELEELKRGR